MPPSGEDLSLDDGVQYSFALEYSGPPLCRDLPRAVPINLRHIPVAAVVSQVSLAEKLSLPVVHPIVPVDPLPLKFSRELTPPEPTVSPTSVIEICISKELDSESTVSPTSVIPLEESSMDDKLSDELSSSCALDFSNGNFVSGELSDCAAVHNSNALGSSSISHDHSSELFGGAQSCSTIDFCDSFDKSRESSSCIFRVSSGVKDSLDSNHPDWESNESVLSMDYPSSRVSLRQTENEAVTDARRNPSVTFHDIESDDGNDEFSRGEPVDPCPKGNPPVRGKKGSCYRCFKGSRFTEKEICIVCDAKYCGNCVLRAMGSMPEGRKCVPCIGYPISESQRGNLGKCSRLLKRLLSDLEVREIMKAEKLCDANQLQPEDVHVNGQPLSHEELNVLQTCANPPKKLKPGTYWYDKVSGLWGKDGQKPSRIISPHLHVGGPIRPDASNGNTHVYINGREITKVELRMLQLAGVQCAGNPHFWVNEDGSYQEEGQKNTKGYIWGKPGTKLLCAFLSLPVPSKSSNSFGEQASNSVSRSVPEYFGQRMIQKILLVGNSGSGTSTIFKQAKILYKAVPFSSDEREDIKLTIQSNVYRYLGILLEGRERFEEEHLSEGGKILRSSNGSTDSSFSGDTDERNGYFIESRLKIFSDWLLKAMASGNLEAIFPAASREYAPLVEKLWRDSAIQATYKRRNELDTLPSVANYFLERAVDILRDDYDPSDLDILYAEGVTSSNGLGYVDFSFPQCSPEDSTDVDGAELHDAMFRYQLIRLQGRGLGENCKWLEMFDDIGMVIFCVCLSDYDQYSLDANGCMTNSMMLSRRLFESIVTNPTFEQMDFLLVLNKFDIFEDKVERIPLTQCEWFDDFNPVVSRNKSNNNKSSNINFTPSVGQLGFHYIAVKFKRLYSTLSGGRKLYVSGVTGLEPASVDAALKYAREILKWDEERCNFSLSEGSMYSSEEASSSH